MRKRWFAIWLVLVPTLALLAGPLHAEFAYVANSGDNTVSGYTTWTNAAETTLRVGANPVDISISSDGAHAYVTNAGAKSVSVIDTTTDTVVATIGVEFIPVHVSISPDGARAYVINADSNSVSVIDTSINAVSATVPVGVARPRPAFFTLLADLSS
jgi:YVTN family beta-propeller protein